MTLATHGAVRPWLTVVHPGGGRCSPNVKQGPPGLESQTLSHYIATVLDTAVDKTQLCIAAGKLSWVLHLTVVVLNEDGNLYEIP